MQDIGSILKDKKINAMPSQTTQEAREEVGQGVDSPKVKKEQLGAILEALPPRYRNITPDYAMLERVKTKGILLYGGVGTGKTHRMLQVISAYLEEQYQKDVELFGVRKVSQEQIRRIFQSVPDVLRQIKNEFDNNEAPKIVERLMKTPILFLDDLGAEKASEWVKEQLYIVINERYNWNKPVMITSNLELKEIAQHYGDRFASRLYEMCEVIKLSGSDRRAQR